MLPEKPIPLPPQQLAEQDIFCLAQAGDETALSTFYQTFFPRIVGYGIHHFGFDQPDSEDLAATTLLKVFAKLPHLHIDPDVTVTGLILTIAHNQAVDWLRQKTRETKHLSQSAPQSPPNPETQVQVNLDLEQIEQAVASLSDGDQILLHRRFYQNMSYAQISRITGKKPNTLAVQYYRAIHQLRQSLSTPED